MESALVDPGDYPDEPHIAPNHIESGTGRLLPYSTVAEDKVISPKHRFKAGQILYSKIRPYLAKAIVAEFAGLCSADMYPISTDLEPEYLHRWLVSEEFTRNVRHHQGRTVLPKINQEALLELPVPVPPSGEQRRIVERLRSLLVSSSKAQALVATLPMLLEEFRYSVLRDAFRGTLTEQWRRCHPIKEHAKDLLKRIRKERRQLWEETERTRRRAKGKSLADDLWRGSYVEPEELDESGLPKLPRGWAWASLEELTDPTRVIRYGILMPGPNDPVGVPYVKVLNIREDSIQLESLLKTSPTIHNKFVGAALCAGDVLLSIRGTYGRVAEVPPALQGANITQDSARIAPLPGIAARHLAYVLRSPVTQRWFDDIAKGVAVRGLNIADIRRTPIPIAPAEEQAELLLRVEQALARIRSLQAVLQSLRTELHFLDRTTLAKAFRGELVPQDPNDEPASVLLERIRAEREEGTAKERGRSGRPRRKAPRNS